MIDDAVRDELVEVATSALADARAAASDSFLEVIEMADRLAEYDAEIVSPIPEDLASAGGTPSPDHISLNRLQTRAEVAIEKADTDPGAIENSRLVLVKEAGEWKLDDLVEYFGDSDMSLREAIENLYAGFAGVIGSQE